MNSEELRNAVITLFGQSFAMNEAAVIYYGSKKIGRDIDIYVVQPKPAPSNFIEVGLLDLAVTSEIDFMRRLRLFDPAITEPVLTGELLCGSLEKWNSFTITLNACRSTDACVAFLQSRAKEQYQYAREILKLGVETGCRGYCAFALQNASWCLSYISFASYYTKFNSAACSFTMLAKKGYLLLPNFWVSFQRVRKGIEQVSSDGVSLWLDRIGQNLF